MSDESSGLVLLNKVVQLDSEKFQGIGVKNLSNQFNIADLTQWEKQDWLLIIECTEKLEDYYTKLGIRGANKLRQVLKLRLKIITAVDEPKFKEAMLLRMTL